MYMGTIFLRPSRDDRLLKGFVTGVDQRQEKDEPIWSQAITLSLHLPSSP